MAILNFVRCEGEPHVIRVLARATVTKGDLVTAKTNGRVQPTATGEPIFGQALNGAASGEAVYVLRGQRLQFIMKNDNIGTTFAATHVAGRFDIIGATGAQLVDTSTVAQAGTDADSGQLLAIEYNPKGFGYDGDTTLGIFELIERQ
jgi:hypothetical protein